ELLAGEFGAADLVNSLDEAGVDGVCDRDAVVAPGVRGGGGGSGRSVERRSVRSRRAGDRNVRLAGARYLRGFAAEGVEKGVAAVVGRPDAQIEAPSDATGSGGPEGF